MHFMGIIPAHIPHREKHKFAGKLKDFWNCPDELVSEYDACFPKAVRILEDGLEDSLSCCSFPQPDPRKISSANMIERLNKEIIRRSRVIGIFPSADSYLSLAVSYLKLRYYKACRLIHVFRVLKLRTFIDSNKMSLQTR